MTKKILLAYPSEMESFKLLWGDGLIFSSPKDETIKEDPETVKLLLLSGGEDVSKSFAKYSSCSNTSLVGRTNTSRDRKEFEAINWAIKNKIPILGICRGMQVINTFFHGTLHADLYSIPDFNNHSGGELTWTNRYIQRSQSLQFWPLLPTWLINVNSFHHQAVCDTGSGLYPIALSTDRITEVMMSFRHSILGIQFHPEWMSSKNLNPDPEHDFWKSIFSVLGVK